MICSVCSNICKHRNREGDKKRAVVLVPRDKTDDIIIVGARTKNEVKTILSGMRHPFFVGLMCESDRLVNRFVNREAEFMDSSVAKSILRRRKDTEFGNDGRVLPLVMPSLDKDELCHHRIAFVNELFEKCEVYQLRGQLNAITEAVDKVMND